MEGEIMAQEKIDVINNWLNAVTDELAYERVSYGELAQIDHIYDSVKAFMSEEV